MHNRHGLKHFTDDDVGLRSTGYRSQAIVTPEGLVFVAGQIGAHPETKEVVAPDIRSQTLQCLQNVEQVLRAVGGDRHDLVELHVFLLRKDDYPDFNEATQEFFGQGPYPTRYVVGASFLAGDALVEISGIAYLGGGQGA